ncbi:major capsid protein [Aquabacterium sp. A3]|uniref:major capsid protein n=1 Tax=Aquabacterium sp. A3 TaxID=3132829 RepID=UPI003119F414
MIKTFKHYAGRAAGAVAVLAATTSLAHAEVDTTSVTGAITEAGTALAVVGAAYVAMRYGAAVWKWLTKFSS